MRARNSVPVLGAVTAFVCLLTAAHADPTYITFDADSHPDSSTQITGINNKGIAVGGVSGAEIASSGFIYHKGKVTLVKYPNESWLTGINKSGTTIGNLDLPPSGEEGGVGKSNGSIKGFHVFGKKNSVYPVAISDKGEIIGGYYSPKESASYSFVRDADGNVTVIDAGGEGTALTGINAKGAIAGNTGNQCFVRSAAGVITTFTAEGQTNSTCLGINAGGIILGTYTDNNGVVHGFLRSASGATTTFDAPGVGTDPGYGTFPVAINKKGTVVGYFLDSIRAYHGFIRSAAGDFTEFDVPVSDGVADVTTPTCVNDNDEVAGTYAGSGVTHGFLRLP
jgi:hypothetical protein